MLSRQLLREGVSDGAEEEDGCGKVVGDRQRPWESQKKGLGCPEPSQWQEMDDKVNREELPGSMPVVEFGMRKRAKGR